MWLIMNSTFCDNRSFSGVMISHPGGLRSPHLYLHSAFSCHVNSVSVSHFCAIRVLFTINFLFTLHPDHSPYCQSHPHKSLPPITPCLFPQRRERHIQLVEQPASIIKFKQDKVHSLPLRPTQAFQLGGKECKTWQESQRQLLLKFMVPHELPICYKCEGILLPTSANSLVSGTITVSPHGPQLVGCVGQLVVSLTLFVSPSLLPTLPHDFPNPVQCWAMSVCIWFHLLLLNPSPTQFSPPSTSDVYCTFF